MSQSNLTQLSPSQREQLQKQGCRFDESADVRIDSQQDIGRFINVRFSGEVHISLQSKHIALTETQTVPCGIENSVLHNVRIGSQVSIAHVRGHIANYIIGSGAIIRDVGVIECQGLSRFGQGCLVKVLNEAGGREVALYDRLDAATAYLLATYRHHDLFQQRMREQIEAYGEFLESDMGYLAEQVRVVGVQTLREVCAGPYAQIIGAECLENGTITSQSCSPAYIGAGVIARNFIIADGARVTDQSQLSNCYVGQGVRIESQFCGENSLYFANSELMRGETCSTFCGPFTVSHHKSTLLIGGAFSFYNAGSGTNQSNHLYKLGPTQHGICERGCKNASGSYVMWPARIGAFTLIMGKHYSNCDTHYLPFSYLIEQSSPDASLSTRSRLIPGIVLRGCGVIRDGQKWGERDRRNNPDRLDDYHFEVMSPYTAEKICHGIQILSDLKKGQSQDVVSYNGVWIDRKSIESGLETYHQALTGYFCRVLAKNTQDIGDITQLLTESYNKHPLSRQLDIGGLIAGEDQIMELIDAMARGHIESLDEWQEAIEDLHTHYPSNEWQWVRGALAEYLEKHLSGISNQAIITLLNKGLEAEAALAQARLADAAKEFDAPYRVSYGLANPADGPAEFAAVRGQFEQHEFGAEIKRQSDQFGQKIQALIDQLQQEAESE